MWIIRKGRCEEQEALDLFKLGKDFPMDYKKINFCPFCGTKLPTLVRNTKIKDATKFLYSEDGDYCASCKGLGNCKCRMPEDLWKISSTKLR